MCEKLGVFPHEATNSDVLALGDLLFVSTSNGQNQGHTRVPSPRAPSLIAVDKHSGEVVWRAAGLAQTCSTGSGAVCDCECERAHAGALWRRRWMVACLSIRIRGANFAVRREPSGGELASAARRFLPQLDHSCAGLWRWPRHYRHGAGSFAWKRAVAASCDQSQRARRRYEQQEPLDL